MGEISSSQIAVLALVIAGLTLVMLATRRRVKDSQRRGRVNVREQYAGLQADRKVVRDIEEVMLELDQLARQVHGRIDTRLAKLDAALREADERIDRLSRLTRQADGAPAVDLTLDEQSPEPPAQAPDEPYAALFRLADAGLAPPQIARETDRTIGEVELILALRRTKEGTDHGATRPPAALPEADAPARR